MEVHWCLLEKIDAIIICVIQDNMEGVRQLLDQICSWMLTKWMVIDLKRNCSNVTPLYINEKDVERLLNDCVVSQEHKVPGGAHHREDDLLPKHLFFIQESPASVAFPEISEESTHPCPPNAILITLYRGSIKSFEEFTDQLHLYRNVKVPAEWWELHSGYITQKPLPLNFVCTVFEAVRVWSDR